MAVKGKLDRKSLENWPCEADLKRGGRSWWRRSPTRQLAVTGLSPWVRDDPAASPQRDQGRASNAGRCAGKGLPGRSLAWNRTWVVRRTGRDPCSLAGHPLRRVVARRCRLPKRSHREYQHPSSSSIRSRCPITSSSPPTSSSSRSWRPCRVARSPASDSSSPTARSRLGFYGEVYVAGLTTTEIKEKIILHLRELHQRRCPRPVASPSPTRWSEKAKLPDPKTSNRVFVDVAARINSKVYYVQGDVGVPRAGCRSPGTRPCSMPSTTPAA